MGDDWHSESQKRQRQAAPPEENCTQRCVAGTLPGGWPSPGGEDARVKMSPRYGPGFYTVMSVLFLALFVLNVCTHGTTLGLISTGGLALLMGYIAYRAWSGKRHINRQ
jgi:hypothetical protein